MTTRIPTVKQCLIYMDQYEMLDNIRAHSFLVGRVAEAISDGLTRTGKCQELADKDTIIAGALLHDIAKTLCLKTGCHHAKIGQQICNELGYPAIGELVAQHVVLDKFTPHLYQKGVFGAKELVYYADKRVLHDQVVSLQERLSYIISRYGDNNAVKEKYIRKNFDFTTRFETYLFSFLDFSADSLTSQIQTKVF